MEEIRIPLCEIVDHSLEYVTEQGFLPHEPGNVYSVEELVNILRAAAAREPHILHLNLRGGLRVEVAIGGKLAAIRVVCLTWDPSRRQPGSWTAKADWHYTTEIHGFFSTGYCPDYPPDDMMPVDDVIQIALYLVEHEELPDTHVWLGGDGIPSRSIHQPQAWRPRENRDSDIPF